MNYRTGLISMLDAVLTVSIAPVRAQDVDSPPDAGPYGAAVSLRWFEAAQLEERGDFNSAQININERSMRLDSYAIHSYAIALFKDFKLSLPQWKQPGHTSAKTVLALVRSSKREPLGSDSLKQALMSSIGQDPI